MNSLQLIKRFNSTGSQQFSDFIICGGGLVGTTVACSLAKNACFSDRTVTMIEATAKPNFVRQDNYTNRVSAISPFSKQLFERLGVWKHVQRYKEVKKMKIWGAYSDNFLELDNNDNDVAYIIENGELLEAVSKEVHTLPNVKVLYSKNIVNIKMKPEKQMANVSLEDGTSYDCHLLIGSDGVNSKVRNAVGVEYLSWNYEQMAVVATLNIAVPEGNKVAWQKFLPDGPLALLPLTNDLSSLVWTTTKEKAKTFLDMPSENFIDSLNKCLDRKYDATLVDVANRGINDIFNQLGLVNVSTSTKVPPIINEVVKDSRAGYPLGFGHSINYVYPNVVLIGDAAHRVHPLAGQGVNLGFQDITFLEQALTEGCTIGRELGDIEYLRKYESLCQQNNIPVMLFIEIIHRIFTSKLQPVQALGDICIKFANFFDPVKSQINKSALFLRN